MTEEWFAVGTTLANMTNLESYFVESGAPTVLPNYEIPLLGPLGRTLDSGAFRADGMIACTLFWDSFLRTELRAFILAIWGNYTTKTAPVYLSGLAEDNFYNPFLCQIGRPQAPNDYEAVNKVWGRNLRIALNDLTLQSATKTAATYTVTTSDKLLYADTTSNTITFTLPALSGVNANVVYSLEKTAAANSMILDPSGAETINNAATLTKTALRARVDYAKDPNLSTNWIVVRSAG